jgi:uncharacterized membrane protein YkoI
MNAKSLLLAAILAAASFGAGNAGAAEKATIERAAAEKIALSRVPGGTIKEGELETEHEKLVWSFDIAQKSSPNIIEVQVDAKTGEIVSVETESPADQAKEAAADAKDHK